MKDRSKKIRIVIKRRIWKRVKGRRKGRAKGAKGGWRRKGVILTSGKGN